MPAKFFSIVAAALLTAVSVVAETGVAVIANAPRARAVAELMLPELSEDPNIALVERENVGSLFKEIEAALLAGNMRDISTKVSMFGADMFAVLVSDKEIEGCSLTVFDAKSGVRLVDVALGSKDKGGQAHAAADYVETAVSKRKALLQGALPTVSVVALRNLDLSASQSGFVRAVGYLLEQLIANAPDLILLERHSLEWVNKERMLIPDALAEQMEAGRVTLEIEIAQGDNKSKNRAAALVKSGEGKQLAHIEVEGPADDPLPLAEALFSELAQRLNVSDAKASPNLENEADRLLWEYLYLRGHGNSSKKALERMEAAAALNPDLAFPYLLSALLYAGTSRVNSEEGLEYGERALRIWRKARKHDPELRIPRDIRADIYGSPHDGFLSPEYFHNLFRWQCRPELKERRRELMRSIVKLTSERTRARGSFGFDTCYLSDCGSRPFRLALLLWIQECPEDIEAWFRNAVRKAEEQREKRPRHILHKSKLGYMGLFLREVASAGLKEGEPPVLDTVAKLLELYRKLDVESTLFIVPERQRTGFILDFDIAARRKTFAAVPKSPLPADVEESLTKGLDWLAANQRTDGSWTMPDHSPVGKTASTGLALLAFLASGEGRPGGQYWPTVEHGLRFLVERDLLKSGDFACLSEGDYPDQGIATLALIEAYLQTDNPTLEEAAKLAVGRIVKGQHESGVIAGRLDIVSKDYWVNMSDFCEMVTPLVVAEKHGMQIHGLRDSIRRASAEFLDAYEEESGGFYDVIWPEGWKNKQHPTKTKEQAKGRLLRSVYPLLTLYSLGLSDTTEANSAWKAIKPLKPEYYSDCGWIASSQARYATTQLMFDCGGQEWRNWSSRLFKVLIQEQNADGSWNKRDGVKQSSSGSYNPAGAVYKTAYNILSLSVPARNLAVHGSLPLIEIETEKGESREGLSLPWISKRKLIEDKRIVFVASDAKDIFVGYMPLKANVRSGVPFGRLTIARISWNGFAHTELVRGISFDTGHLFYGKLLSNSHARTALSSDDLFVGYSGGVLIIPRNGGPMRKITTKEGLPSNWIQSLTWMDGWLYAAVGAEDRDAKIVRINPVNGDVEPLLQSGRLGSDNPLENLASPPRFRGMAADPARKRVLMLAGRWASGSAKKAKDWSGLWEYAVDQGRWRRLVQLTSTGLARMHSSGDYLLVAHEHFFAVGYDLANDQIESFWGAGGGDPARISKFEHSSALLKESEHFGMPHELIGDWFWSSEPFLRGNLETGEVEKLPPLEKKRHMIAGANRERGYLLVATEDGLWALELKSSD